MLGKDACMFENLARLVYLAAPSFKQSSREKMLGKNAWLFERLARRFRLRVSSIHAVKRSLFECMDV
ncbi:MAG: hypothetical protein U5R06_03730 [candidate division KSB1 bacterium]|nr:hypothetical protein [candidate division KSB1 bacterium]